MLQKQPTQIFIEQKSRSICKTSLVPIFPAGAKNAVWKRDYDKTGMPGLKIHLSFLPFTGEEEELSSSERKRTLAADKHTSRILVT